MGSAGFADRGIGEVTRAVDRTGSWTLSCADGSILNTGSWSAGTPLAKCVGQSSTGR